ncbi:glycosyl hydrolase 115 family protein [Streptomyces boncukensis]|uniref:Glycosyl hydrolase n=1 Tax=Streptomyces boncukensis TaxID=2711219 RepID=A0A6G4X3R1_9ACTN|nr:glycosyl hydrolase 115 family protein [Streptomyces boncukensis]NGO71772.1 glycosyl hydrolase [Streptomyces boncukensis]
MSGQEGAGRSGPRRRVVLGAGAGALGLGGPGGFGNLPVAAARDGAPRRTDFGAYISFTPRGGAFPLVRNAAAAPVAVDAADHPGVRRAAADLCADIERVTGVRPELRRAAEGRVPGAAREVVLVGTLGRSPLIDRLVDSGALDPTGVAGRWETSLQAVVERPMPGIDRAFVVAGSDPRGAVYAAYDVSYGIGVSPWYWWDDVPPVRRRALYALPGRHTQGTPAVKYRGIFINDENPALGTWAPEYFGPGKAEGHPGGFNADFYARVFEVMLRLRANYLWPAVWGRAFAEDDPDNHARAQEYGIVLGTSHEAPMMRGIEEWNRHAVPPERDDDGNVVTPGSDPYGGTGEWSFRRNADAIKAYWRDGVRRMAEQGFEGVVTLGMRGNGDVSLPDGDGIELMREIITTQRTILAEETGKDPADIPQVWTLYKEVQRYWERGLRAPDDVTVVLCDDNWGNIRMHPDPGEPARAGGYGLYYHFDYVGLGRNYKWVDTASLPNVWDQLRQAHAFGNRTLWVANVGDLKGNELPTQFFLDYAWNPGRWDAADLPEWERRYAAQHFGEAQARSIAAVLAEYARLQSLRKPELLNRRITLDPDKDPATDPDAVVYDDEATPFSLDHHRELEHVTERWRKLAARAERIAHRLPGSAQDAWFQLVGYAVTATANVYALREAEFTNLRYAGQGRWATNQRAARAEEGLERDFALADRFNSRVAGGKWKGFQTQPHIGYGDVERYGPNAPWQQPERDHVALPDEIYPAVRRIEVPGSAALGVAVAGSGTHWPGSAGAPELPPLSRYGTDPAPYIEVFNRGRNPFDYRVETSEPWLRVDRPRGRVTRQRRLTVRVDWRTAPSGTGRAELVVHGPGTERVTVAAVAENPDVRGLRGFVEAGGYIAIDAEHADRMVGGDGVSWQRVADLGRGGTAGVTPAPVTAASRRPGGSSPRLDYTVSVLTEGRATLWVYLSPRNPALAHDHGLRYAVSFDDDPPHTVDIIAAGGADDGEMNRPWARNTSDNVNRTATRHTLSPGVHRLTFWMVDPTVVLQRLLIDTGGLPDTYLGPPESRRLR